MNKICKTVIIDNHNTSCFNAHLIVWPGIVEQHLKNISVVDHRKLLVGPKYTLLGNVSNSKNAHRRSEGVLISMGGSDKRNLLEKIVKAFKMRKELFHVKIIIGNFYVHGKRIENIVKNDTRFTIIKNNDNLVPLMSAAKIGIFTFGVTTFEALNAGLPSLIISHSRENDLAAKKLAQYGCTYYLGYYKNINFRNIPKLVLKLISNSKLMREYSRRGKNLIDGRGNKRVARKIVSLLK